MMNKTIITHDKLYLDADGWAESEWYSCEGFDKVGVTLLNDSTGESAVDIYWTHDVSTYHGMEYAVIEAGADRRKAGITEVKAKHFRFSLHNADTVGHEFTVVAYLR